MSPEELLEVADRVVEMADASEQVEAVVSWSSDTEVRAFGGEVEHVVASHSAGVGIRVIDGGRQGMSWADVLEEEALRECLAEARDNARFSTPDPDAGLAEPDGVAPPALDLLDPAVQAMSTEDKIRLAIDLEAAVLAGDTRIVGVESADYGDTVAASAVVSTTGIRAVGAESSVSLSAASLASDGDETTTGMGFSVARGPGDLDPAAAAADAVERAVRLLGAAPAPSRRLTVVFDPYVASQFLALVAELLSGEEVLRGRSPFAGRLGEEVASPLLTLVDDPTDPASPTAVDTDGEGLATRRVPLIDAGRLQAFLHNAYTGRASGSSSTGSAQRHSLRTAPGVGAHSVVPTPGSAAHERVLADIGDGLLVRELAGLHSGVNPVSGDLSVGVDGQLLRGGVPCEPVREVTIASSLQRMLRDVVAVGADLARFPWESAGVTLAVQDVTMSGR